MRVKEMRNTSKAPVHLALSNGKTMIVQPGGVARNVHITNYEDIRESVKANIDLTEVNNAD